MAEAATRPHEPQLVAEPPGRHEDTEFYRWVTFVSAAIIGIALAVLWNHQVADPIAMAIQRGVVGTTTPAELVGALALAFVAGASMVVTA
jgi:hypothetical protein